MESKFGILLDKSVILSKCQEEKNYSGDFFYFLESRPHTGIVTHRILAGVENRIRHHSEFEKSQYSDNLGTLMKFLKTQAVGLNHYLSKLPFVTKFFEDTVRERMPNPTYVSPIFRKTVAKLQNGISDKIVLEQPEEEDIEVLTEAACIKEKAKDNTLFLASQDRHFCDDYVSRKIEERFGIKCRWPRDILSEIRQNGYLPGKST
jgi:hypothetical protein